MRIIARNEASFLARSSLFRVLFFFSSSFEPSLRLGVTRRKAFRYGKTRSSMKDAEARRKSASRALGHVQIVDKVGIALLLATASAYFLWSRSRRDEGENTKPSDVER